jgi:hypothetical protein
VAQVVGPEFKPQYQYHNNKIAQLNPGVHLFLPWPPPFRVPSVCSWGPCSATLLSSQTSLNKLLEALGKAEPFFIRCIRSNAEKVSGNGLSWTPGTSLHPKGSAG